jgi:eukaryotic-like serine/threonine-protein kinase
LTRLIRVGNSCAVWEAVKGNDGERYALKVLRQDLRDDRQEIGYLRHEYEVASKLRHPNIIKIHEFNTDGAIAYLVLELYSEQNMKQALRLGPEAWAYYVPKIVQQSSEALYTLHTEGWVHCDVKPDNFLLSSDGSIKLIDFTIAEKIKKFSFFSRKVTRGTRSYMSPEQIRGKALDERADVYSFGCVLFELLTGRPPYTAMTPDELLEKHLKAAVPSVQVLNGNVTTEVAELIRRMMAKRPQGRPVNMWEFLKEFRTLRTFKKMPRKPDRATTQDSSESPTDA